MNANKTFPPIRTRSTCLLSLLLLAIMASCAVGPNYSQPATPTPAGFRFDTAQATNSFTDLHWQEAFPDPALQQLINTALTNSYDIKQAVARVEQSHYAYVAVRSPLFPQIGYGADIGRGRNALYNTPADLNGATKSSVFANVNAAWEMDFWGRIRRLTEAARAQYLATDEARRGVMISLVSDVAVAYYQLLDLDQELQIQYAATNAYAGSFRIFDQRKVNGVASRLETDRASAELANAAAIIPELETQIALTEDRLNVLLGRLPGPIERDSLTNQPQPELNIPAGLPSELLRRRPDVQASEQLLIAANANIGASLADFFPKIGLTTFFGRQSPELSGFTAGTGNLWNVGGTMAGPLFQGGRIMAHYRGSKAAFEEARAAYQQSVLNAFADVSDALITRQKLAETRIYNQQAVDALTSSVGLATDRYMNGKSSYYEVLQAQQELYPAQRAQVQSQAGEWIAVVQLYKALGGGWQFRGAAQGNGK